MPRGSNPAVLHIPPPMTITRDCPAQREEAKEEWSKIHDVGMKCSMDEFYVSLLVLRTIPFDTFLAEGLQSQKHLFPMSSVKDSTLLSEMGLPRAERNLM